MAPFVEYRDFIMVLLCHNYFLDDRINPSNTITSPNPKPNNKPILIRLIKIPSNNPRMIANMKDISPLLISGFRSVAI